MKVRNALVASVLVAGSLLVGGGPAVAATGIRTYTMTVKTGNLANADTEDAVRFAVQGDEAGAPSFRVDRDFRRGETVTFSAKQWESLGTIRTVTVQKSAVEDDAWYLEYVQVHDEAMGRTYVCPVNAWFAPGDSVQHRYTCS